MKSKHVRQAGERSLRLRILTCFIFRLRITFIDKEGDEHNYEVAKGDNLLDIAQSEELEMEGEQLCFLSKHLCPTRRREKANEI